MKFGQISINSFDSMNFHTSQFPRSPPLHEQVIEEILLVQLRVIGLTTFQGRCGCSGEVRLTHPLQVSTAVGAAGTHPGPNALSLIARLQHRWHLSKRKSCDLLKEIFGLSPTPGGLVGATHRLAAKLAAEHKALQGEVRHCDVLHNDETGFASSSFRLSRYIRDPQIYLDAELEETTEGT